MSAPSNSARPRRNEELKFANAGPFARLLNPIRAPKPKRDRAGNVLDPQPRYAATSAERYDIGAAIGREQERALGVRFGSNAVVTNRPKERRGGRRG